MGSAFPMVYTGRETPSQRLGSLQQDNPSVSHPIEGKQNMGQSPRVDSLPSIVPAFSGLLDHGSFRVAHLHSRVRDWLHLEAIECPRQATCRARNGPKSHRSHTPGLTVRRDGLQVLSNYCETRSS